MFDHVSIGVRDLARARQFYDAALRPLGYAVSARERTHWAMGETRSPSGLARLRGRYRPILAQISIFASLRRHVRRSTRSTLPHSAPEATTMVHPGCGRTMARTTTLPSRSTLMGIASRPTAAVRGAMAAPNPCYSGGRIDYRTIKDGPPSDPKGSFTSACTNAGPCACLNRRSGDATDRRYLLPAERGLFPALELAGGQ